MVKKGYPQNGQKNKKLTKNEKMPKLDVNNVEKNYSTI